MPSPSLTFDLLLSTLYGSLTQFIFGGDSTTLVTDIVTSWLGFALGQAVGQIVGLSVLSIGSTYVVAGTLGSIIALVTKRLLARRRRVQDHTRISS
jgi:uncharacterized membrane protein YeaQ/YmgE (transglycosylase-associated protein family)